MISDCINDDIPSLNKNFEYGYVILSWKFIIFCSFKKGCCQLQAKYVDKVLVNRLIKLAHDKV